MISLNTNVSDLILQRTLLESTMGLNEAINRMTTGLKVNHAKDNAAGYSIIEDLNTRISSMLQVQQNAADGISLLSLAQSNIEEILEKYSRLRELSIQASNGTNSGQSLEAIQAEADAIMLEIDRLKSSANFDGNSILGKLSDNNSTQSLQYSLNKNAQIEEPSNYSNEPVATSYSLMRMAAYSVAPASTIIDGGKEGTTVVAYNNTLTINIDGVLYDVKNKTTSSGEAISWSKNTDGQITFTCNNLQITAQSDVAHNVIINGTGNYFYSGDKDDTITISSVSKNNKLYGGEGSDTITIGDNQNTSIYGEGGNDIISAGSYANTLYGGDGDDIITLRGQQNPNQFYGDAGNDTFNLYTANTITCNGGDGDDTFNLYSGKGIINGDGGTNIATGSAFSNYAVINTTNANASIVKIEKNSSVVETINGVDYTFTNKDKNFTYNIIYNIDDEGYINFSTAETINVSTSLFIKGDDNASHKVKIKSKCLNFEGGNLDDEIRVSALNVGVIGNDGNDNIYTDSFYTYIRGGEGDDIISTTPFVGRGVIFGDGGNDTITVGCCNTVSGGTGDDTIITSSSGYCNSIYDEDGNNTLIDNATNTLVCGFGDSDNAFAIELGNKETKTITIDDKQYTIKNNKSKENIVYYSLNPITKEITFGGNNLDITGEENAVHNITLQGYYSYFYGGSFNDTIKAYGDAINLFGGGGDDNLEIIGGTQNKIFGEAGNDSLKLSKGSAYDIDGGEGDDILTIETTASPTLNNKLIGGDGNDTFYINNTSTITDIKGDNYYEINSNNLLVSGGNGNDTFVVNGTNNTISGGAGNDYFVINSQGVNTLDGGVGEDYAIDNSNGSAILSNIIDDPNSGILQFTQVGETKNFTIAGKTYTVSNSTTQGSAQSLNTLKYSYNKNLDQITIEGSNLTIDGSSVSSNILLKGSNNVLTGSNSSDKFLVYEGSNNVINSASGDDIITMNSAENSIISGAGNDKITLNATTSLRVDSGSGNDSIVLNSSGNTNITSGSGNDRVEGTSSSNIVDLSSGDNALIIIGDNNEISADDEDNEILLEGNFNDVIVGDGKNIIAVSGEENNITIGDSENNVSIYGDSNELRTNSGLDTILIEGDSNNISSLDGNKEVTIKGDSNSYQGGSGIDTVEIRGNENFIALGSGNDVTTIYDGKLNAIDGQDGSNDLMYDYGVNTLHSNIKKISYEPFELKVKVDIGSGDGKYITTSIGFNNQTLDLDFSTQEGALNNIAQIDNIMAKLEEQLLNIGSTINRLELVLDEQEIKLNNMISSRSTLRDADIAVESSKMIKQQILQQASATLMASSRNLRYENVLGLLNAL